MDSEETRKASRRHLLKFLAGSPLLALASNAWAQKNPLLDWEGGEDPTRKLPIDGLISNPKDAINVFDFEFVARKNLPPAHFGYLVTGADDESTLRANRTDFGKFPLRQRRVRDVSVVDTSIELFGQKWASPIFLCPSGANRAFHPEGELAVSRAAQVGRHLQILSTLATYSIEDAIKARGAPIWFQLYATEDIEIAKLLLARAERAGSPVVAITVDSVSVRKNETAMRLKRLDTRNCLDCHESAAGGRRVSAFPNFAGFDAARVDKAGLLSINMNWDTVRRLKDATKMKVVLKGIIAPEDAELCVKYGMDGVYVSNHGGRGDGAGTSTISALPEIVAAVNGKMPILVDSGFRRGMDAVKALAMGATAVGVGRPYLWGLSAFGQAGVERVLDILRTEVAVAMGDAGAAKVRDLVPAMVRRF